MILSLGLGRVNKARGNGAAASSVSLTLDSYPLAVPEKRFGLALILAFFDRCAARASLLPPPAALGVGATGTSFTPAAPLRYPRRGDGFGGCFQIYFTTSAIAFEAAWFFEGTQSGAG